jgi:hypothetical protein
MLEIESGLIIETEFLSGSYKNIVFSFNEWFMEKLLGFIVANKSGFLSVQVNG